MAEYHEENVMMFTRIMQKLEKKSPSDEDVTLSHSEINVKDFPCANLNKLKILNTLCKEDSVAMKILVRRLIFVIFKKHVQIRHNLTISK